MWLYCLCGGGNLGSFGGTASGLLAFHTHFFFYLSSMAHSQYVCVGLQLSALEMHSVVQLCCYFVVSSFVHSLSIHIQNKRAELLSAREDLKIAHEDLKNARVMDDEIGKKCGLVKAMLCHTDKSSGATGLSEALGRECAFCGYRERSLTKNEKTGKNPRKYLPGHESVVRAHLLPSHEACAMVGVSWYDKGASQDCSNFLPLCGTKNDASGWDGESFREMDGERVAMQRPSCHKMFDNYEMSLIPTEGSPQDDRMHWTIVGGGDLEGTTIRLQTKPHRFVMLMHLEKCVERGTLKMEKTSHVADWLKDCAKNVTPPRHPQQDLQSQCDTIDMRSTNLADSSDGQLQRNRQHSDWAQFKGPRRQHFDLGQLQQNFSSSSIGPGAGKGKGKGRGRGRGKGKGKGRGRGSSEAAPL